MKWEVTGADRATGEQLRRVVEADTEASVRRKADRRGIDVTGVRPLDPGDSIHGVPFPAAAPPAPTPASPLPAPEPPPGAAPALVKHVGESFADVAVVLDGQEFRQCTFTRCQIVFRATGLICMDGNKFDGCVFGFEGPASDTIGYLGALYHGMGQQGRQLVERVFDSVRRSAGKGAGMPSTDA